MKWLKRSFWLILAVALGFGAYHSLQPKPILVDTAAASRGVMEVTVDEDGKTRIKEKYIVSTPVAGRLQRIELREGDVVKKGDTILASIQPSRPDLLDARSIAEAQARVAASTAAVARSEARCDQTRGEMNQAEREFKRNSKLVENNAISRNEFERQESQFHSLSEAFRSAQFERDIANYELELARAALVHSRPGLREDNDVGSVEYFMIHSPIDGVVLRVLQESSTIVTSGTPIVELGDPTDLEIVVDLLSTDAVKVAAGTKVHIEQWGGDQRLDGAIRLVEPSAFEKISALGVEEQRVNVIVDFTEPSGVGGHLGDGYRVEARMVTWSEDDVLHIPTSALFRETNEWAVFVFESGFAKLKIVQIGARNDRIAQVLKGVTERQTVILHPGDNMYDGAPVVEREED